MAFSGLPLATQVFQNSAILKHNEALTDRERIRQFISSAIDRYNAHEEAQANRAAQKRARNLGLGLTIGGAALGAGIGGLAGSAAGAIPSVVGGVPGASFGGLVPSVAGSAFSLSDALYGAAIGSQIGSGVATGYQTGDYGGLSRGLGAASSAIQNLSNPTAGSYGDILLRLWGLRQNQSGVLQPTTATNAIDQPAPKLGEQLLLNATDTSDGADQGVPTYQHPRSLPPSYRYEMYGG